MAQDVSGFGTVININASTTFPIGLPITQFSDDADPLDMATIKIADTTMGVNGDLIRWAKAVSMPAVITVIAGSIDDVNLQILFDANRVAQGKVSAADEITMTVIYPDLSVVTLSQGSCIEYMPGKSISGSGRLKTKTYSFAFQTKIGV